MVYTAVVFSQLLGTITAHIQLSIYLVLMTLFSPGIKISVNKKKFIAMISGRLLEGSATYGIRAGRPDGEQ